MVALPPNVNGLTVVECFDHYELTTSLVKNMSNNVENSVPLEESEVKEIILALILWSSCF